MKIDKKNFGRFFPKLNERSNLLVMPSLLILQCNCIEMLRLRQILILAIEQKTVLEQVYHQQCSFVRREALIYLKEPFKFPNEINDPRPHFVNFIQDGPASDLKICLAIDEFDSKLRSTINFTDSECFKALILPLGLEELRAIAAYEIMNLQTLILATRMN
jgi:hypothetical protein